jgi:hypothetical protein
MAAAGRAPGRRPPSAALTSTANYAHIARTTTITKRSTHDHDTTQAADVPNAIGAGDQCAYCRHRSNGRLATIKLVLPSGVQVCPVCDA